MTRVGVESRAVFIFCIAKVASHYLIPMNISKVSTLAMNKIP